MDEKQKIICSVEDDFYRYELSVDPDEVRCFLTVIPSANRKKNLPALELYSFLEHNGIVEGLISCQIEHVCHLASQGKKCKQLLIAEGRLPEVGSDGWLEFYVTISSKEIQLSEEDKHGAVNLKSLNLFSNVVAGDLIGFIHSPGSGKGGVTVTGLAIPAMSGKPLDISIDESVKTVKTDTGMQVYAEQAGRVVYAGNKLCISKDYIVEGNVDYHVGNIDFLGLVEIKGNVLDGFSINGNKGVKISGMAGACTLLSDGDVIIEGMAGKNNGCIRNRGKVIAKTLIEAFVECEGDVIVTGDIRNSIVKSGGWISVVNGSIIGGECIALKGIEAAKIGSYLGIKTRITAGVYFPEYDALSKLKQEKHSLEEQIHSIEMILGPLADSVNSQKCRLSAGKRMEILRTRLEALQEKRKQVIADLNDMKYLEHEGMNPKINVSKTIFEGVAVSFGQAVYLIQDSRDGSFSVIENSCEHELQFLPLSKLSLTAEAIQEQMDREQYESCKNLDLK